jgi:hypothetical protein
VETDTACEVEVLDHRAKTFEVFGHHYAIVCLDDLEPGKTYEYEVALDGETRWPEPDSDFPASRIRTYSPDGPFDISFGSCRVALPHEPPYTLSREQDERGMETDALHVLATEMLRSPEERWPHLLLLLGDQAYADEGAPQTREFIRSRRDTSKPPYEAVADFEEMRAQPWWHERIVGAFMAYWLYQHLGNLSPQGLGEIETYRRVQDAAGDAGEIVREYAARADRDRDGVRWSFHRDLGRNRVILIDSRVGRVLEEGHRSIFDDHEWEWIRDQAKGNFDHLLIATSDPYLLAHGMHWAEVWSEQVCNGVWGKPAARLCEKLRRAVDLDHWASFQLSFHRVALRRGAVLRQPGGEPHARWRRRPSEAREDAPR